MTDLKLTGPLNLSGRVKLVADGGKVLAGGAEVLVEVTSSDASQGTAPVVPIPPPPAAPKDPDTSLRVLTSFLKTVTVHTARGDRPLVAQGLVIEGTTWPGAVLPSSVNPVVRVEHVPVNVVGDQAIVLPLGAAVPLTSSGQ
jgi:hypothetical protein